MASQGHRRHPADATSSAVTRPTDSDRTRPADDPLRIIVRMLARQAAREAFEREQANAPLATTPNKKE
jgi:hypothetical protein